MPAKLFRRRALRFAVLYLLLLAPVHIFAVEIDTDFGNATQRINYPTNKVKGSIYGVVPKGWRDDSNRADVDVTYVPGESEGINFLRLNITRLASGNVQMRRAIPDLTKPVTAELTVTVRNQTGAPVQFGIRHRGKPFQFIWRSPPMADAEWVTRTFRFPLPRSDQPVALMINTKGIGHLDIARVTLVALDRAAFEKRLRSQHPDGGPANVLRLTRFPAGLPAGWSIDRKLSDGSDLVIAANDAGVLMIDARQPATITGAPFRIVNPAVPHCGIASVSGTGDWRLEIFNESSRPIVSAPIKLNLNAFVTTAVDFNPDLFKTQGQLRLRSDGPGTLNIAWVKVGPARKVASSSDHAQPIIDLRLTGSDAAAAGVQFTDEQAAIEVHALDAPADSQLCINLVHGQRASESFTMPAAPLTRFETLNDADHPLGAYRVEAWLEAKGQRVSPIAERVVYRLRRPRAWGRDAPESALGVHTNPTAQHAIMAKAVGINWVRLHDAGLDLVGWHLVEPTQGHWVFNDDAVQRYRDHDLMIFGQLGTAPAWASYYPADKRDHPFGYWDKYFQPRDLDDYVHYVRTVTERYRDEITHWDVWNEPWIHAWWGVDYDPAIGGRGGFLTSEQPQADYVKLKTIAFEIAKSVNPDAVIAGFNTTTNDDPGRTRFTGDQWTRGVYAAGGLVVSDVLTYHHSASGSLGHPGDAVELGLANAFGVLFDAGNPDRLPPIWMTEGQPNIGRSMTGMYQHTLTTQTTDTFFEAGDHMVRYLTSMRANCVERVFLYSMHGFTGMFDDGGRWRTLTQPDGTLHPVGAALSTFAYHTDGLPFIQQVELASGVFAYVFGDDQRTAAVVLTATDHAQWSTTIAAEDLWGNPLPLDTPIGQTAFYMIETDLDSFIEPR